MGRVRFLIALWGAKCARLALKLLRRNATYFPGFLALKLCPNFLRYVGKPKKIVAVTGSNGKTTVSNLLNDVLTGRGHRVLNNQLGSNVAAGIATSLLSGCTLFGKTKYDMAVLEVDERSSKRIYPYVKPDYLIITNLFRDSPMRNAHPQYIASFIEGTVPAATRLILNADDLISSGICPENPRVYFGIDRMKTDVTKCVNLINDVQICPVCCGELEYDYRRYHHIGKAHCTDCGFKSPESDYFATDVDTEAMTMTITDKDGGMSYRLLSDSIFNIYNVLTAVAALRELGLTHEEIKAGLDKTKIVETRFNAQKAGDVTVVMQMSKDKNALAGSRAFDYISGLPGKKELILMMNCIHDQQHWSENVTWLYDCDFEFLNNENITRIVATGPRAKDYYLRLLFAGVPEEKIRCTLSEMDAPALLEYNAGESVCLFYGTDALDLVYRVQGKIKALAQEASGR
ncbi:UDP-N-acetylmuramyl tripeptide synthase [Sporobacter termitidis DSM 10068]|uniref:Lipid II isoglutaminyl synthase (glutamine-hydrolyzing) subunit MurT n=1 Tax=Sporobacter termitidis DSM 10068 TaxID=1123282 RepID=A0A1M5Z802_9FIRM|nr:Mur ligase family protein [Sporobacter termitidis]SHI20023.1 UDP-N-acetylmuramyl tripeptide synthase [Sporobacter termitidis DSM 10068]